MDLNKKTNDLSDINSKLGLNNDFELDKKIRDESIYHVQPNIPTVTGGSQTSQQPSQSNNNTSGFTLPTENNYADINGIKNGYQSNAPTGQGVEAAVGTDYSWNKQGSDKAQKTYSSDVLTAKQNALNNRQTIENNAVNYQTQADMMKYQNNQNAEKVGWTGGYVLDQNRQMDYLKASIQAQMYGAMELQKYGYESSLAAARLSYDLNQQEYARQYYQDAISAALSEAQLTGTYFSAETKDMMGQMSTADQNLMRLGAIDKDGNPIPGFDPEKLSPEDRAAYDQANTVKNSINNWFSSNGISKQGVKTLEAWQADQSNELAWSEELWKRYDAAMKAAKTDMETNSSAFFILDENGKETWDGVNVSVGNWDTMTAKDVGDYLLSGPDGQLNTAAVNQFYSYLDSTLTGEIESGFKQWCESKGFIKTNSDGSTQITQDINEKRLKEYIKESGIVEKIYNKYSSGIEDDPKYAQLYDMFMQWDFTIQLPDGKQKTYTYSDLLKTNPEGGSSGGPSTGAGSYSNGVEIDDNGKIVKTGEPIYQYNQQYSNIKTIVPLFANGGEINYSLGQSETQGTANYMYKGLQLCNSETWWDKNTAKTNCGSFDPGKNNREQFYYDQQFCIKGYPTAKDGDLVITPNDNLWIKLNGEWRYVQGGDRDLLKEDLKTAYNGETPDRWKEYVREGDKL